MRDILPAIMQWRAEGQDIALATVVRAEGSAPRREGARLAVTAGGQMAGSVSGGCVENDVIYHALETIRTGVPLLRRYAITPEMTWEVGLACGGAIEVWVEKLPLPSLEDRAHNPTRVQAEWEQALASRQPAAVATLLAGPPLPPGRLLVRPDGARFGSLGDQALDGTVAAELLAALHALAGETSPVPPGAQAREILLAGRPARVFVELCLPPPHLIILGAGHIAIALASLARTLDYRVTIVDPRTRFANRERFPPELADNVVAEWPAEALARLDIGPTTYCAIVTHDPKIDDPALLALVGRGAGYVGAIGSARTHAERLARLAALDVPLEALARIYAPIGLDIGAETPEEIALAILAEIVAVRRGAPGGSLRARHSSPSRPATP